MTGGGTTGAGAGRGGTITTGGGTVGAGAGRAGITTGGVWTTGGGVSTAGLVVGEIPGASVVVGGVASTAGGGKLSTSPSPPSDGPLQADSTALLSSIDSKAEGRVGE